MSQTQGQNGSQLTDAKPSNKRTITVKFKQVCVLPSGHVLALDEKGFLWQSQGTLEDAMWKQVRQPKIDVEAHEDSDRRNFQSRRAPTESKPLSQKLPLSNVRV